MFTFLKRFLIALFVLVACSGFAAGDTVLNLGSGFVIPSANLLVLASASYSGVSSGTVYLTSTPEDFDKDSAYDGATYTSPINQVILVRMAADFDSLSNGLIQGLGVNKSSGLVVKRQLKEYKNPQSTIGSFKVEGVLNMLAGEALSFWIYTQTTSTFSPNIQSLEIYRIK